MVLITSGARGIPPWIAPEQDQRSSEVCLHLVCEEEDSTHGCEVSERMQMTLVLLDADEVELVMMLSAPCWRCSAVAAKKSRGGRAPRCTFTTYPRDTAKAEQAAWATPRDSPAGSSRGSCKPASAPVAI